MSSISSPSSGTQMVIDSSSLKQVSLNTLLMVYMFLYVPAFDVSPSFTKVLDYFLDLNSSVTCSSFVCILTLNIRTLSACCVL